jgi:hypothetical protein
MYTVPWGRGWNAPGSIPEKSDMQEVRNEFCDKTQRFIKHLYTEMSV